MLPSLPGNGIPATSPCESAASNLIITLELACHFDLLQCSALIHDKVPVKVSPRPST